MLGEIVRYINKDGNESPAIITNVLHTESGKTLEKGTCQLTVFRVERDEYVTADHGNEPGNWHNAVIVGEREPEKEPETVKTEE